MSIWSRAPTRVDLAGGTLDIWPLYLLMDYGLTVNVAITISGQVRLEPEPTNGFHLVSEDTGFQDVAHTVSELDVEGPLGLVARAVRHFNPPPGLKVVARSEAPQGSGLGASSSLLVALLAALQKLGDHKPNTTALVNLAADIEAQVIRIPTGKQDYYSAVYGGANAIWFEPGKNRVESLPLTEDFAKKLRDVMVLSFTGQPRLSALTNWRMVKGYIDGRKETRAGLAGIRDAAVKAREAWLAEDVGSLAGAIAEEWEYRKNLARGVTTRAVEKAMAAAADAGALACKICGAGGGGCMISIVREGRRAAVADALASAGASVLDFDFDTEGLVVHARD